MTTYYQQGDIMLKKCHALPDAAVKLPHKILLKSVDRDNAHRFAEGSAAILFQDGEKLYADVGEPSQLIHDEHKAIAIAPGIYEMDQVREFSPETEEIRRVID